MRRIGLTAHIGPLSRSLVPALGGWLFQLAQTPLLTATMPVQPEMRQKLTFSSIVLNTVYNAFLLLTLLMISISLNTYEWIQTDVVSGVLS